MKTAELSEKKIDKRTRQIEAALREHFKLVDAYTQPRSWVIRVRVVDNAFKGKNADQRENMVFPILETLPKAIQNDVAFLLMATPQELTNGKELQNLEFEDPSPSYL